MPADNIYSGRLTLKFNVNDPAQKYAYDILSQKGRTKSAYISERFQRLRELEQRGPLSLTEAEMKILAETIANILREDSIPVLEKPKKKEKTTVKKEDVYEPNEEVDTLLDGLKDFG